MKKRTAVTLAMRLAFVLLFSLGCQKEVGAGPIAPDFWLPDLTGEMATLQEYRGQVVLLDFWATWCLPCRVSIPELVELQQKYRSQGVAVVGVAMDDPAQTSDADLRKFAQKYKINYRILRYNQKIVQDYFPNETPPIPTLFVIDREGRIQDRLVGFTPGATERSLQKVIP